MMIIKYEKTLVKVRVFGRLAALDCKKHYFGSSCPMIVKLFSKERNTSRESGSWVLTALTSYRMRYEFFSNDQAEKDLECFMKWAETGQPCSRHQLEFSA